MRRRIQQLLHTGPLHIGPMHVDSRLQCVECMAAAARQLRRTQSVVGCAAPCAKHCVRRPLLMESVCKVQQLQSYVSSHCLSIECELGRGRSTRVLCATRSKKR